MPLLSAISTRMLGEIKRISRKVNFNDLIKKLHHLCEYSPHSMIKQYSFNIFYSSDIIICLAGYKVNGTAIHIYLFITFANQGFYILNDTKL